MPSTVTISLSHGDANADLFLQFGEGTDNPSVMIENHNGDERIAVGDIQRLPEEVSVTP